MNEQDQRALAPKLRFPEFRDEEGWEQRLLGLACQMQSGKFVSASEIRAQNEQGLYPCYGGNGLRGYTASFTHSGRYSLIGRQGALCGNVRLGVGQFHATEHAVVVTPENGIKGDWLFFVLDLLNLNRFATGQAQPGLSIDVLEKLPIAIPRQEPEQQKIADCLSSVDELIAAQARKVNALKTHKKGLMQQLFPREGETQPRLRFPEFQDAGDWVRTTFGAAATFINGKAYKQEELLEKGKYRVLRVGNYFTNKEWYISDLELEESKYCGGGDLLYAWSASFGPRIWAGEKVIYHYHIWKVIEANDIDKQFLFLLLDYQTERMKAESSNGLGLLHITKGAIESWECSIPTKNEQKRIADCLTSLDDVITAQIHKREALKTHKKGLMQQLFLSPEVVEA